MKRAGLPESTFAAFRVALEVNHETGFVDTATSVALSQLNATAYFESDGGSDLVFVWVQKRCEGNRQQVENLKPHCVQDADGTKEQTQYCRDQHEPNRASDDGTLFSKPMLLNYHVSRLG
jgi:hypothetical protein